MTGAPQTTTHPPGAWTAGQLGITSDLDADPRHPDRCQIPHNPGDPCWDTEREPDPNAADRCPTCQGVNRSTTDMVCMTCGRDYMPDDGTDESAPGHGWKRLMGAWREQCKQAEAEVAAARAEIRDLRATMERAADLARDLRVKLALRAADGPPARSVVAPVPSAIRAACSRCAQMLNADLVIPFGAQQSGKLLTFTATYVTPHVCLDLIDQESTYEQIPVQHARAVAALAARDAEESASDWDDTTRGAFIEAIPPAGRDQA